MPIFAGNLDYSGGDWSLTINGTDYTAYVESASFEWSLLPPIATESPNFEPIVQIGNLTLIDSTKRPLSTVDLDPTSNADFKQENLVVFTRDSVTVKARIARATAASFYPETYDINSVIIELTDKLGLVNRDFPAINPNTFLAGAVQASFAEGISYGVVTWFETVRKKLTGARNATGTPYFTSAQIITSGLPSTLQNALDFSGAAMPDGFDSSQGSERNPAREAARIAALRGYFLYCDAATEEVKFCTYPLTASAKTPTRIFPFEQVELGDPESADEDAVDSVEATTVQSSRLVLRLKRRLKEYPVVTHTKGVHPVTGREINVETRIDYSPTITDSSKLQRYEIYKAKFHGFPQEEALATDTTQYLSEQGELIERWADDGLPTLEGTQNIYRALGEWSPESFPGGNTATNGQPASVLTYYFYDKDDRRPTLKRVDTRSPAALVFEGSTDATIILTERVETPYNLLSNGKIQSYDRKIIPRGKLNGTTDTALALDPDFTSQVQFQDGIEKPQGIKTEDDPPQLNTSTSEANATSLGSSSGRRLVMTLPGGSKQHATLISQLAIAHSQDGRITFSPQRPLESNENLTPLEIEIVGDRLMVRDGLVISIASNNEIAFSYTGRQKSRLSTPVVVPKRPAPVVTETLTMGTLPDRLGAAAFVLGVPIVPIELIAFGGTPPYTFSAVSGLPAGLSITSGVITGTPTTVSTGTATIQVTTTDNMIDDGGDNMIDDGGDNMIDVGDTDTDAFDWAVVLSDAGISHYGFIYTLGTVGGGVCGYNIPEPATIRGTVGGGVSGYSIVATTDNMIDDGGDNMIDNGGDNMIDA